MEKGGREEGEGKELRKTRKRGSETYSMHGVFAYE